MQTLKIAQINCLKQKFKIRLCTAGVAIIAPSEHTYFKSTGLKRIIIILLTTASKLLITTYRGAVCNFTVNKIDANMVKKVTSN